MRKFLTIFAAVLAALVVLSVGSAVVLYGGMAGNDDEGTSGGTVSVVTTVPLTA